MAKSYYEDVINKAGLEPIKAEDLQAKFDAVTEAEYDKQRTELQNTENKFYNKLYDTQQTTMDTIRQANAQAVATGASKGVQAANELSALLGLQQESVEGATDIANKATTLAQDETQAMLENVLTAETQAREANQNLANILVQAGSVDVEGQNADTAKEQVQQQWQQLIEQIRQTNPTVADQLQTAYTKKYGATGLAPTVNESQKVLTGQETLSFKGKNYKINSAQPVGTANDAVNRKIDNAAKELGYTGSTDPNLKNGTTITITANQYRADDAGLYSDNAGDVISNILTVGMWGLQGREYTLTYYDGKWYPSTRV